MNKENILRTIKNYLAVALIIVALLASGIALAVDNGDVVHLQVLSINDFHGALAGDARTPGVARVAALLERQKAAYPDTTLILSAGDMFQGTMDSNLLLGAPVISFMNYIGFDAMALGNHEFDWGIDNLRKRAVQSNFPVLAANVVNANTGKQVDFCQGVALVRRQNITIGIIGYATQETPEAAKPDIVAGLKFTNPANTVEKYAKQLRAKGADVIVVLSHMGSTQDAEGVISGEAADFAKQIKGVDLIVSGHSHANVNGTVNGIRIVQALSNGKAITDTILDYSVAQHKVVAVDAKIINTDTLLATAPDANVQAIMNSQLAAVAAVKNRVIGNTNNTIGNKLTYGVAEQTLMGQLVTDVMRQAVRSDMAFTNIGGLRTSIDKGTITVGAVYQVLPFDNTIETCTLSGAQIMDLLNYAIDSPKIGSVQYSGLRIVYDPAKAHGQRIIKVLTADGQELGLDKAYTVATNDFMAIGGDGYVMFKQASHMVNSGITLRDYVTKYIMDKKTINIVDDGRLQVVGAKPLAACINDCAA